MTLLSFLWTLDTLGKGAFHFDLPIGVGVPGKVASHEDNKLAGLTLLALELLSS